MTWFCESRLKGYGCMRACEPACYNLTPIDHYYININWRKLAWPRTWFYVETQHKGDRFHWRQTHGHMIYYTLYTVIRKYIEDIQHSQRHMNGTISSIWVYAKQSKREREIVLHESCPLTKYAHELLFNALWIHCCMLCEFIVVCFVNSLLYALWIHCFNQKA